jgi:hypothetical protein
MPWIKGFDFRQTITYIDDITPGQVTAEAAAGRTYVLEGAGIDAYPTTRNGVTFGWLNTAVSATRNRNAAIDYRLSGVSFNNGGISDVRVDLPAAGDYLVRLAAGDNDAAADDRRVEVLDNASSLFALDHTTGFTTASDLWRDATDVLRSATTWPSSNAARTVTFTSTICILRIGTAARFGIVAHFELEQVETTGRRLILSSPTA